MTTEVAKWLGALNVTLESLAHQQAATPEELLNTLSQFCVDEFDAAFARIWLINEDGSTLVLTSSRGQYTRLDGTRSRIPIGQGSKIDKIFVQASAHITNDVLNDPGVKDKEWAKREGFTSFAGYPLCWGGTCFGVLGMYSRKLLSEDIMIVLELFVQLSSAVIFQHRQTERNMNYFCEVTGFKRALLDRLVGLGEKKHN
jgi:GAF domain-containing protein